MSDVHTRLTELVDKHFGSRPTMPIEDLLTVLEQELPKRFPPDKAWQDGDDRPLPEDAEIDEVFPTESGRDDLYAQAMRMVGAKYSKGALVALVNMLLHRVERAKAGKEASP